MHLPRGHPHPSRYRELSSLQLARRPLLTVTRELLGAKVRCQTPDSLSTFQSPRAAIWKALDNCCRTGRLCLLQAAKMATAAAYSATSCSRFFSAPLACRACHERLPARPLITAQRIPVWNGSQLSGELARPTSEYPKNGDVEVETKTSHASWSLEYASSKCPCVMEHCSLMLDCGLVADCSIAIVQVVSTRLAVQVLPMLVGREACTDLSYHT